MKNSKNTFCFFCYTEKVGVTSTDDRELILSKLYDLQQQQPTGTSLGDLLHDDQQRAESAPLTLSHPPTQRSASHRGASITVWHDLKGSLYSSR